MLENKVILVTGGAGFIGSHLVDKLLTLKIRKLIIIDNLSSGDISNLNCLEDKRVEFYKKNIEDLSTWDLSSKVDIVFNLAALVSVPKSFEQPELNHLINVTGFLNVLEFSKKQKVEKVIFASSSAVYGESNNIPLTENSILTQTSPYGFSKFLNEFYAKRYFDWFGVKSVGLRFFNVFGTRQKFDSPYSGVISIFTKKMKNNETIKIYGNGKQIRDFIYVNDVVNGLIKATEPKLNLEIYNLGSGHHTTINELFITISNLLDYKKDPIYEAARSGDISKSLADIRKISKDLQFNPMFTLKEGLTEIIRYLD